MKKALLTAVFFAVMVPFFHAYAQSNLILVSQGTSDTATSTCTGTGDCYFNYLGKGYTAKVDTAFVTMTWSSLSDLPGTVFLESFTDSAYSNSTNNNCWLDLSSTNAHSGSQAFVQYATDNHNGDDDVYCTMDPTLYYVVLLQGKNAGSPYYWGIATSTKYYTRAYVNNFSSSQLGIFAPQFALGINGFTIVATTSATGLSSLSGAQTFCNAQFGTSTNGLLGIGTDLSNGICQIGLFLFIPSTNSLTDFQSIPTNLETKFPFAWGFQIKNLFDGLTGSSTANYPDISYAIGTTTPGYYQDIVGSGLAIANGASIQKVAPDSTWTFIRYLIGVILWISFAYFVYRKIIGIWHVQT